MTSNALVFITMENYEKLKSVHDISPKDISSCTGKSKFCLIHSVEEPILNVLLSGVTNVGITLLVRGRMNRQAVLLIKKNTINRNCF